jgi:hypothetical protein
MRGGEMTSLRITAIEKAGEESRTCQIRCCRLNVMDRTKMSMMAGFQNFNTPLSVLVTLPCGRKHLFEQLFSLEHSFLQLY